MGPLAFVLPLVVASNVHDDTVSWSTIAWDGSRFLWTVDVDADRMLQTVGVEGADGTDWSPRNLADAEPAILAYLSRHIYLERDGVEWLPRPLRVEGVGGLDPTLGMQRTLRLRALFALDEGVAGDTLGYTQELFLEDEVAHQHFVTWVAGEASREFSTIPGHLTTLDVEDPSPEATRRRLTRARHLAGRDVVQVPWSWLFVLVACLGVSGVVHRLVISIAFVAAGVAGAVSAFQQWITPDPTIVRWAIPFALVYVAGENVLVHDRKLRAATSALFGGLFGFEAVQRTTTITWPTLDADATTSTYVITWAAATTALCLAGMALASLFESRTGPGRALRAAVGLAAAGWAVWHSGLLAA